MRKAAKEKAANKENIDPNANHSIITRTEQKLLDAKEAEKERKKADRRERNRIAQQKVRDTESRQKKKAKYLKRKMKAQAKKLASMLPFSVGVQVTPQ